MMHASYIINISLLAFIKSQTSKNTFFCEITYKACMSFSLEKISYRYSLDLLPVTLYGTNTKCLERTPGEGNSSGVGDDVCLLALRHLQRRKEGGMCLNEKTFMRYWAFVKLCDLRTQKTQDEL